MIRSRNTDIIMRKLESISISTSEVNAYFVLVESILMRNSEEVITPNCIFNLEETGIQFNSRPGQVLAKESCKALSTVTSTEKGKTITFIACCNTEGTFSSPACIKKGKK